jgi:PhoH-like ATPase
MPFRTIDSSPDQELHPNEYMFQVQNNGKKVLVMHNRNNEEFSFLKQFKDKRISSNGAAQAAYISSLVNERITLVSCSGLAGTGKSFLAVAAAIEGLLNGSYKKIKFVKPFYRAGDSDAIGTLPGELDEKIRPYLHSYMDILKELCFDEAYLSSMLKKKQIEFEPIEFMRGRTFRNSYIIVDEAQSLSWDMIYLLVSRLGEGSKLVVLGDLNQIDSNETTLTSGLNKLVTSAASKNSPLAASHTLDVCCRSETAKLAHDINRELRRNSG